MRNLSWIAGLGLAAGLAAGASPAGAQVLLANFATPATAVVGSNVTLNGCGFPAGIQAVNTLVTFTPAPGAGLPVTATASSVSVTLGNCYAIQVAVPTNIVAGNTALTVANAATSAPAFSSVNFSSLTITGAPSGITLNTPAAPSSALPGTLITLVASGFPGSTPIPAGNVMVTIQPATGAAVSVPAQTDPFTAPGTMQPTFLLPNGLAAGAATITLASANGTSPAFISINTAALTIEPVTAPGVPLGPVSPATVAAGLAVSMKANGLPAGTIPAGNILVTLTPPPGNGGPITVPATLYLAMIKTVNFPVSTGFTNNAPILCGVAITNKPGTLPAFALAGATVTVTPPPTDTLSPGVGQAGTAVNVTVTGDFTHFGATSKLSFTPFAQSAAVSTITASNLSVVSTTELTATLNIGSNATPGAYTVEVTTGTEVAHSGAALVVTTSPGLSFNQIVPNGAALGQTLTGVAISANATHFLQGSTILDMGPGILVTSLQVVDATDLLADISISPTTNLGPRTVSSVTGGEFAVGVNAFTVTPSAAALTGPLSPNSGPQGTNVVALPINGANTHFLAGATQVSFGGGIQTGQVTVLSPTSLTVDIAIPPNTALGPQNLTVTTGGEVVSLAGAFTVTPGTPYIASVAPNSGEQGQTNEDVVVQGALTNFQPGEVTVSFGGGDITVNSVTVDPVAQTVTVNLSIAQLAATGGRTATLVSNTTTPSDYTFNFSVTPSPAAIGSICVSPTGPPSCDNGSPQNSAPTLLVTGVNTHWVQGTTQVAVGDLGFSVDVVTITSPTTATLNTTIAPNAGVGLTSLTFTTGGEVATGTFHVLASLPTMTLSPPQGLQGASVPVAMTGDFTHWCDNVSFTCASGYSPTTAAVNGAGVTIQNLTINSPASASATLAIAPGATLGSRTVTLTTGLEAVTAQFQVVDTPAALIHIAPGYAGPSGAVNVEILGQYTHFESGVTAVTAGPDIAVSNLVVKSATDLTATLTMDGQAALGWRDIFVNTIDAGQSLSEQLTIGFSIVSPVAPVFTGIQPSAGYQGQVLTVTMTGVNTNWQPGVTQALVGGEVTVNSLTINSPTSATAVITVSPYAPLGGNPIVMITGADVDSGPGLSVVAGPAQVLGLCRIPTGASPTDLAANTCGAGPVLVGVGQTLTVNLTGQATHWEQGATALNIGGGQVYTDSLTILDPTHAQAQLTVLSTATPGFQPVTMTTLGEVATIAQGIDLVNSSPTLLSATPNSGQQGATLNVQVLGRFTHWCDGGAAACDPGYAPTVANLPQGDLTINSITVQDSETAVLNITVNPLAYPTGAPCPTLTMTTGTEQVALSGAFCITPGPATLTSVTPNQGPQGQTTTVQIVGLETHFVAGETTANFGSAVQAGNVQVQDATHATVDLAVTANAPVGFVNATLTTLGETATLDQAFTVVPGTPTLNEVSVVQGEQGQSFQTVQILGQYTHFCDNGATPCGSGFTPTTVTFGQGITVSNLQVVSSSEVTVDLAIDPLAFTGSRNVTVTTGTETVNKYGLFQIVAGPAILSQVTPGSANQGQEVVLTLTGQNTHWQQGLTQFSIAGAGYDVTVHSVLIESPTAAQADVSFAPTAGLGARSVYMVTAGEALNDAGAVVVTGGIPAIASVTPGSALAGSANVNVTITGLFTAWLSGGVSNVDFGTAAGSGINLISYTVNSDTSITAVVNISPTAPLQYDKVTVTGQTQNQNGPLGVQALTGYFQVVNPVPPPPYIDYISPGSAIPGQTLDVSLNGVNTHWDLSTQITFGAGIAVLPGTFSVTSPTSAVVTVAIDPNATGGSRTVTMDTGSEQETAGFYVVIAQPTLSIVDPGRGLQGANGLQVNVIGSYTDFNANTTFQFGGANSGVTVTNTQVLGPTVAQVTLDIAQLAPLGGMSVTATTPQNGGGSDVVSGAGFTVTPSLATITAVTPNTGYQGNGDGNGAAVSVTVSGEFTHWDSTTTFQFGDGITASNVVVDALAQTATMDVAIPPFAGLGPTYVQATTGGEIARLNNAFVVQAGTPIILSASTGSGAAIVEQQQTVPVTILGQVTQWDSTTSVTYGPGFLVSTPVSGNPNCTGALNPGVSGTPLVTGATAMTVCVTALALTHTGSYTLAVTTADQGNQLLELPNSLYVQPGPAAVTGLTPNSGKQGQTLDVAITGTNTNFAAGVSSASFGPGISVNALSVTGPTSASANLTIAANATPGLNSVSVTTAGETASTASAFQIQAATPVLQYINPAGAAQGQTTTVTVTGVFTHFTNSTVFNFGPGVTVGPASATNSNTALVSLTVSPIAAIGPVSVTATTGSEVAAGSGLFTIGAGPAALASVAPAAVRQNQTGAQIQIAGTGTHFTQATPAVSFGPGTTVTQVQVASDTLLTATVNVSPTAAVGSNTVTVTTGGEVATLTNGLAIQAGLPLVTGASPATLHQNDSNFSVAVTGLYTHWVQGTTTASVSPADITVNAVTVTDGTHATLNLTASPTAALGSHTLTLTTGAESAPGVGALSVLAGLPQIVSVNPATGAQGATQTVTVTALYTHFVQGTSQVSFSGGGLTTGAVTVNGPTELQVPVTVTPGAAAGARSITVTTGGESASLANAFTVQPGLPAITVLSPNVAVANSSVSVGITGQFSHFVNGTTTASFGAGISVGGAAEGAAGPVQVTSATSATAQLTIDAAAALGPRSITVATGSEVLDVNNGFTVQSTSPTAPQLATISPANGAGNVPTNTAVTMVFTAPLDRATVTASNATLVDTTQGGCNLAGLPATVSVDASGRIITLTPGAVLAVGRQYDVCLNYPNAPSLIRDPSGNALPYTVQSFTTGFGPDTSGPALTYASIAAGAANVPTNAPVVLGFTRPIDPATVPAGFTVAQSGVPVAGTYGYTPDYTQVTFTPAAPWTASAAYTVAWSAELADSAAIGLANPGSLTFTAGSGPVTSGPGFLSWNPRYNEAAGENPVIEAVLNRPINPLATTAASFYVRNSVTGAIVPGATVSFSPDRTEATLTLAGPLDPGTAYRWYIYGSDFAGNTFNGGDGFTTGAAVVTTPPAAALASPPAGAANVAVNPLLLAQFTAPVDWTTVAGAWTLLPAVQGNATLASDNATVEFTPSTLLAANTTYTATLAGLRDVNGNAIPAVQWTFTTGATATADTANGTIAIAPANGAVNVATNTAIVLTLSKPADPASVTASSVALQDRTDNSDWVPANLALSSDGMTITMTPQATLAGSHQYCVYASWNQPLHDLANNIFSGANACFTTAAGADLTPPQVMAVMPGNGATGIGPNNPVTVTFSKAMNPATLTNGDAALYIGSTLYTTSVGVAGDNNALTFNGGNLPYATTFTVVISPGASDLAGNPLPQEFSSTFTTMPQPATGQPQVEAFRPGAGASGVAGGNPLTFFLTAPLNPATVPAALTVAQNGAVAQGVVAVSPDGQVVTFTPAAAFLPGALVQVWFSGAATDFSGNPLASYQTSFTIAPATAGTAPQLTALTPNSGAPVNTVFDAAFNQAMNPATATTANFYLQSNGAPVAGAVSVLNGGRLLRFTPAAPLAPNAYYVISLTSGLQSAAGVAFAGTARGFAAGSATDTTAPTVVAFAPADGSSAVGVNALLRMTFSKPIEPATVDGTTLTLSSNGTPIPYTVSFDGTDTTLTLTPQAPLPPSAPVTLAVTALVSDVSGNPATPASATFQTGPSPVYSNPVVIATSVQNNDANVPITSSFTATFDRAMDTRTYSYPNTVQLVDTVIGQNVPATLTFTPDGRTLTVSPAAPLALGRSYVFRGCGLTDLTGNSTCWTFNVNFTTALTAASGGPQVLLTTPAPTGSAAQPVNLLPEIEFDRPVARPSAANITLQQGGTPVAFTPTFSNGDRLVTLAPTALLRPNTAYLLTVAGVTDTAGNAMTTPVTVAFTTSAGIDLAAPQLLSVTPANGAATGTTPVMRARFSEPLDPIRANGAYLYNRAAGAYLPGVSLNYSPDRTTLTLAYPGPLQPNTQYQFAVGSIYDDAGNTVYPGTWTFTTAAGPDTSPFGVLAATPPANAAGVPLNAQIALRFTEPADATTAGTLALSPATPGTTQLSSDGLTLSFTPSAPLAANTAYTLSASGWADPDGNVMAPYSETFTTGGVAAGGNGTVSLTSPAPGTVGAATTTAIQLAFSRPVDPLSFTASSVVVSLHANGQHIAGTTTLSPDAMSLTFTPLAPLPANAQIDVAASYYAAIDDLTGVGFSWLFTNFTTGAPAAAVPPAVIAATPADQATNVGPDAVVTLTFNEALNPNTVNGGTFTLYNGESSLNPSIAISPDNHIVTLTTTLPYSTPITVSVSTGVQDVNGDAMAAPFRETFTTTARPITGNPGITQMRPANGAGGVAVNSLLTLYASTPIAASTVNGSVVVTQNGAAAAGTAALAANGQALVFTPAAPFPAGALVQVFVNGLTDNGGNAFSSFAGSFTVAPDLSGAPLQIASLPQNAGGVPTNAAIVAVFNQPINPATVSGATFYLEFGGTIVAATISQPAPNVLRLQPSAPMPANTSGAFYLTSGLQDTGGMSFSGGGWGINTAAGPDTTLPAVAAVTPQPGDSQVGDNAALHLRFNKIVDTSTINAATLTLASAGQPIPYTLSLSTVNNATNVTVTPQAPLPDAASVTLALTAGVEDYEGNAVTPLSDTFQTQNGPDFSAPALLTQMPNGSENGAAPLNTSWVWVFNKALDPNSLSGQIYNYNANAYIAFTQTLSPDGTTVTLTPAAPLSPADRYNACVTAYDLSGNGPASPCTSVAAASAADSDLPQVRFTTPTANAAAVPVNTLIELQFNEPLDAASLGQIQLLQGATPVPMGAALVYDGSVVRLTPAALLQPNTTYTISAGGVVDLGGNAMGGPYTYSFTTGPNPVIGGTQFNAASVSVGGTATTLTGTALTGVDDGTSITLTFSAPVEIAELLHSQAITLAATNTNTAVPFALALSADGTTVTVTPLAPLSAGTQYTLSVNYYGTLTDQDGYPITNNGFFHFTTQ